MLEPATSTVDETTNPHLRGPFAPVANELDVDDLPMRGMLPPGLEGTYVRNGPNPQFPPLGSYSFPFDGDGMLHAITFEAGRARYRNRWVVTRSLAAERRAGHALYGGILTPVIPDAASIGGAVEHRTFKNCSNASVVRHAGKLLSLWEGGVPYEITPGLGTVGEYDFGGALPGAMCAHPKLDPVWDELCWFRASLEPPYLVYGVVGPKGNIVRTTQIDVPRPVMMHDFAVTDRHVVFFDCPAVLDPGAPARGAPVLAWRPEYGTRFGVMPRDGDTTSVRWFPVDDCYVSHVANAYSDGETVVVDHVRQPEPDFANGGRTPDTAGKLYRAVLDLRSGSTTLELLDTRAIDFPRIDDRRSGLSYRYAYAAAVGHGSTARSGVAFDTLLKIDVHTNATAEHRLPDGVVVGEPIFVPRPSGDAEDAGWLLAITYDTTRDTSELLVLATEQLGAAPVVTVRLPQRVPAGLHGTWLPGNEA